ncbi:MAG: DEAD/DEAH box helicase [Ignavibacteriaceae bacterium]
MSIDANSLNENKNYHLPYNLELDYSPKQIVYQENKDSILKNFTFIKETANHIIFEHQEYGEIYYEKENIRNYSKKERGYVLIDGLITGYPHELFTYSHIKSMELYFKDRPKRGLQWMRLRQWFLNKIDEKQLLPPVIKELTLDHKKIEPVDIKKLILDLKYNNVIYANTGTGKTTSVLNVLVDNSINFIVAVPLRILAKQISAEHKSIELAIDISDKEIFSKLNDRKPIVTTYERFNSFSKYFAERCDWIVVVDEFHKLVSDSSYRNESARIVNDIIYEYRKFIGLTGTPHGCMPMKSDPIAPIKISKINCLDDFQKVKDYHIIKFNETKSSIEDFKTFVSNNICDGVTGILLNNGTQIDYLAQSLNELNLDSTEIIPVYKEIVTPDYMDELVEEWSKKVLKSRRLIIIATSLISTGISIRFECEINIFIYNESNIIEVTQFINRFRYGVKTVYDFISKESNPKVLFNFNYEVAFQLNTAQNIKRISDQIEAYANVKVFEPSLKGKKKNYEEPKEGYLYNNQKEIKVNYTLIQWAVLNEYHSIIKSNPKKRKAYLKFCKFRFVDIINYQDLFRNHIQTNLEKNNYQKLPDVISENDSKKHIENILYQLLKDESPLVLKVFLTTNKLTSSFKDSRIKSIIPDSVDENKVTKYRNIILNRSSSEIILTFIYLYKIGFEENACLQLCQNTAAVLLRSVFELFIYSNLVYKRLKLQTQNKEQALFFKTAQIILKVLPGFKDDYYSSREYKIKLIEANLPDHHRKYFASGPMVKLKKVFNFSYSGKTGSYKYNGLKSSTDFLKDLRLEENLRKSVTILNQHIHSLGDKT